MTDTAMRLLEMAGDLGRYVVMRRSGPIKYSWRYRPPTRAHAAAHLDGWLTIGAELRRQDGTSCALAWDGDTPADWLILGQAARVLARAGAAPLLERSPAGRGGHLWLLFPEPIDPSAGQAVAHQLAPALAQLAERWPRPDKQAVRLPGGYYQTEARGIRAAGWCCMALVTAEGPLTWVHGPSSLAGLLAAASTPAGWLPALLPLPQAESGSAQGSPYGLRRAELPMPPAGTAFRIPTSAWGSPSSPVIQSVALAEQGAARRPLPAAAADPRWVATIGARRHTMYFWIRPAEAAAWFNARHPARELLPPNADGYGRAIWRRERTASVGYRPDGGGSTMARVGGVPTAAATAAMRWISTAGCSA